MVSASWRAEYVFVLILPLIVLLSLHMSGEEDSTVRMNWEGKRVYIFHSIMKTPSPARMFAHTSS